MLAASEDTRFRKVAMPDVPDISERPNRSKLKEALQQYQCAYRRTSSDESPFLLILFMTAFGKVGIDVFDLISTAEKTGHDILFVGDTRRDLLLQGVEKWGLPLFESAAAMELFAESHGKKEVDIVGHSSGATTALYYAPLMKARRCILFEPRTKQAPEFLEPSSPYYEEAQNIVRLILDENVLKQPEGRREDCFDLRNWIVQTRFDTEFHVHYAVKNRISRSHAENLSGLPKVSLHAYEYRKHNLTTYLHQEGQLKDVLLASLGAETDSAE